MSTVKKKLQLVPGLTRISIKSALVQVCVVFNFCMLNEVLIMVYYVHCVTTYIITPRNIKHAAFF